MKKQTIQKLTIIAFVLSLALIWGQSCINMEESQTASDAVVDIIKPLEEIKPNDEVVTVEYDFLNHFVRKGAHIAEFTVIGIELALIIILFSKKKQKLPIIFVNTMMAGMLIGLIDETIQIFSERGTQVKDIWFDVIGAAIGAVLVIAVYLLKSRKQRKTEE
jgi:VanZ family protein